MTITVGFVGMTHLGLVSATGTCSKGFDVVCVDANSELVANLQAGRLPVMEPDLDEMLAANGSRQQFMSSFADLACCDVVYIAPDVPTDDAGCSDLSDIEKLIATTADHLGESTILVILCQVPPGFTRAIGFPAERLFYQVETLIFGRAVERAVAPERFIVGCSAPENPLPMAYQSVLEAFGCPILPMRYESAELAKISINMCLVASIGVANTMAEVCEHVGADWSEIVPALKLDRRIGQYSYLAPGLGIAGGNLERDLATILRLAEEHDADGGIVSAWLANSAHRRDWALRVVRETVLDANPAALVAVWGLAYKENTRSVKNSPSLATIAQMPDVQLRLHDPEVAATAVNHAKSEETDSALDAARGADALMILTPWPEYARADVATLAKAMAGRVVIDPYRMLDADAVKRAGLTYYTLGMAPVG
jgi:UDPglucose 6-dehydrogenase